MITGTRATTSAIDEEGTAAAQREAATSAERPFFDRGPGYARLAGGRASPRWTGSEDRQRVSPAQLGSSSTREGR